MTPVPEILLPHNGSAKSVPMWVPAFVMPREVCSAHCAVLTVSRYSGPPLELVFYIGDQGLNSGWWPFGTASSFNDLIDNSAGCKVGLLTSARRCFALPLTTTGRSPRRHALGAGAISRKRLPAAQQP